MSNISLKQLEVFIAVVEWGSFTEASRHLYLVQSTVSSHINALEEVLRVTLFSRKSKKNITLTADGKRVYQYAKDVVERCNMLEADLAEAVRRELLIGASSVPSKSLLPRHICAFSQSHPESCCIVRRGDSAQIQQMVLDGDVQIGFVGSTDNRQALSYERIMEDRLVLVAPNTPRFAALHKRGIYGRELLEEPMIFRDQGSGTQKMIDNYLSERDIDAKKMRIRHYASDPELLLELVAQGAGVSILSALFAQDQVRSGRVLAFEMEEESLKRNIYMVYRNETALSALARDFAALIRQSAE